MGNISRPFNFNLGKLGKPLPAVDVTESMQEFPFTADGQLKLFIDPRTVGSMINGSDQVPTDGDAIKRIADRALGALWDNSAVSERPVWRENSNIGSEPALVFTVPALTRLIGTTGFIYSPSTPWIIGVKYFNALALFAASLFWSGDQSGTAEQNNLGLADPSVFSGLISDITFSKTVDFIQSRAVYGLGAAEAHQHTIEFDGVDPLDISSFAYVVDGSSETTLTAMGFTAFTEPSTIGNHATASTPFGGEIGMIVYIENPTANDKTNLQTLLSF